MKRKTNKIKGKGTKDKKIERISKPLSIVQIEEYHDGFLVTYPDPNCEGNISEFCKAPSNINMGPQSNEDCKDVATILYTVMNAIGLYNFRADIRIYGKYNYSNDEDMDNKAMEPDDNNDLELDHSDTVTENIVGKQNIEDGE